MGRPQQTANHINIIKNSITRKASSDTYFVDFVTVIHLPKVGTSIHQWRAVLHLGELRAVLQLGTVGALSHLVEDWTISFLSKSRGSSVGTSRFFLSLVRTSSSRGLEV